MRVAVGVALGLAFLAGLVLATLRETQAECEVCVDFGGRRLCRTSSAADEDTAMQMAQATACAVLSNGVTQGIQCRGVRPVSVRCGGD